MPACAAEKCDRLWVGKPSQYVTSDLGQLSLPPLWGMQINIFIHQVMVETTTKAAEEQTIKNLS